MTPSPRAALAAFVTLLVLTAGCLKDDGSTNAGTDGSGPALGVLSSNLDALVPEDAQRFTGTVARDGAGYGVTGFQFTVPEGALGVHVTGEWAATAPLELRIASPEGDVTQGVREGPGRERAVTRNAPAPGEWTLRVVSPADEEHAFTLTAWVVTNLSDARVDEKVALGPGEWLEVNLVLEAGATFQWAFDADKPVTFDVHSHSQAGGLVTHAQGESSQRSGAFTAPESNVYSFFAEGADGAPVTLTYAVKGPFRLSSRIVG